MNDSTRPAPCAGFDHKREQIQAAAALLRAEGYIVQGPVLDVAELLRNPAARPPATRPAEFFGNRIAGAARRGGR